MKRRGFTLVELLIVLAILIILFTMVIAVYQTNHGTDRMRAAARQLQSAILGARDRAIHAKAPRGIRLILDSADPTTATSFIYITQLDPLVGGTCTLSRPDTDNNGQADSDTPRYLRHLTTISPTWVEYYNSGLLRAGSRVRIPSNGSWYTISDSELAAGREVLVITTDHRAAGSFPPMNTVLCATYPDYTLELAYAPTQGEQPITLPSGCVIDLDNSRLPTGWWDSVSGNYVVNMDIMFSPRGTVTGPLAATGIIHFLLAETGDTTIKIPGDAAVSPNVSTSLHKPRSVARTIPPESTQGEKLIVTLFTRTGAVTTHPVDVYAALGGDGAAGVAGTDDDGDGNTDTIPETGLPDPKEIGYGTSTNPDLPRERYRFAETGASAGK
jgi:prepilin-type N-terminal cleavage/methylation domain-containing protein